jgi:aryl-alcohol dehydrogenase-like predicted oxidoreductase
MSGKLRSAGGLNELAAEIQAEPTLLTAIPTGHRRQLIVPIPGTRKLERLDENIGAVAVELTPDDLRDIESAASRITVQGARYPEHLEGRTNL